MLGKNLFAGDVMSFEPSSTEIMLIKEDLAETLLEDGRYGDAIRAAEEAIACDERSLPAWLVHAAAAKKLNRPFEAIRSLKTALKLVPNLADVHANLGSLYADIEEFDDACHHLQKAIALMPGLASAHANLGSVYMRLERPDLAEPHTRHALAIDPNLIAAHQNLAAILMRRNPLEARHHRDAAYRERQIFTESGPPDGPTALILTGSGSGNVPYSHLLPRSGYTRIVWHVDYAPEGQENQLPPFDFVFNAVADCDEAQAAHKATLAFASICRRPLLNNPFHVERTSRTSIVPLLQSIDGLVVPQTRKIETADAMVAAARISQIKAPWIVRPVGRHGGEDVILSESGREVCQHIVQHGTCYATQFVDYRSPDGKYRKYRMIFVDRKPYPYHLAIGDHWLVHYRTSEMGLSKPKRVEEEAFLLEPQSVLGERGMRALAAIGKTIDLDYAGIDFSLLPDGRLLLFEANATMLVHPEDDPIFDYKKSAVGRILNALNEKIAERIGR